MNFKSTTHEPCLYSDQFKDDQIYFLRQVDDFSIACEDKCIAKSIIASINSYMSVDIKYLGLVTCFNGVNVLQTKEYIKIYGSTYITKILEGYTTWMLPRHYHSLPIPMKSETSYNHKLENSIPSATDKQRYQLQRKHKLNYRQAVGELIYDMVTYRPDITFHVTKVIQYYSNPTDEYYEAIKETFYYLKCTQTEDIHFWRSQYNIDLPSSITSHETEDSH